MDHPVSGTAALKYRATNSLYPLLYFIYLPHVSFSSTVPTSTAEAEASNLFKCFQNHGFDGIAGDKSV